VENLILPAGALLSAVLGFIAGYGSVYVFNKIPAKWLCDYHETPGEKHLPPRIGKYPFAPLFALVFAAAVFKAGLSDWRYAAALLPALWLLLQIGIADRKYRIIPDQYVLLLAVTAIGFAVLRHGALSQLLGLVAGGGGIFLVGLLGKLLLKKDALGFGDVKFMAVCGLIAGLSGIILIFILASLSSAVVFGILLARGRVSLADEEALGPFIAGATALYLIFSREIDYILSYYSFF
jgi:prepilin signal peptidase PulO-like enzyme (type II secretory pathway)